MPRSWTAAVAVIAALAATPAAAQKTDTQKTETDKTKEALKGDTGRYGDAGCGLGSMAFGNQGGAIQILAATLNGLGGQTFAITSGTSNCAGMSGGAAASIFIEANREALAKDISRGSGETIGTLTWIVGCADSKVVGATLQRNFKAIFPSETVPTESVTASILATLKSDPTLACRNIG
jgi:Protein of unknown function (DUF3015)